jgi:hypothetical protein
MTLYEWKITDLGNGQYGYIWIAENGKDEFGTIYKVWVDPENNDRWIGNCDWLEGNMVSNIIASMECPEEHNQYQLDPSWYRRILFYWRRLGSPHIDRKAPGYEAPWFPWQAAGFTAEERDSIIAEPDTERIEVQHE